MKALAYLCLLKNCKEAESNDTQNIVKDLVSILANPAYKLEERQELVHLMAQLEDFLLDAILMEIVQLDPAAKQIAKQGIQEIVTHLEKRTQ